jgi:hypothetical protein
MRAIQPNLRLIEVMRRMQCSNKGLARRVRQVGAEHGDVLNTDHVTVKRWRDGALPRGRTPEYAAEALSRKAGYPISLEDIGMVGAAARRRPAPDWSTRRIRRRPERTSPNWYATTSRATRSRGARSSPQPGWGQSCRGSSLGQNRVPRPE